MMRIALPLLGVLLALTLWQLAAAGMHNPGLFPPVPNILLAFSRWIGSGNFWLDLRESLPRALLALLLAVPLGIALGMTLALSAPVHGLFNGWVQLFRSLPPVALLPLFILWFGIGWYAKVAAAAFVCLFPVIVTTMQGTFQVAQVYRELAHDLQLKRWQWLSRIILPGALPAIVPGIRLAAGTSFVMVFVSELAGASAGLGYRISIAALAYQADLMMAALLTLGGVAVLTDLAIVLVAQRVVHYAGK